MAKETNTKEKIRDLGEDLIRKHGFNSFSYKDISIKLKVKNAAIHYHFPSKEDLGVSIIKESVKRWEELLQFMASQKMGEWEKLIIFIEKGFETSIKEERVCLVGALSPELYTLPKDMQKEFSLLVETRKNWLAQLLREGKKKKVFHFDISPEAKALMIITNLMGGLQIARVTSPSDFKLIKEGLLKELKK